MVDTRCEPRCAHELHRKSASFKIGIAIRDAANAPFGRAPKPRELPEMSIQPPAVNPNFRESARLKGKKTEGRQKFPPKHPKSVAEDK